MKPPPTTGGRVTTFVNARVFTADPTRPDARSVSIGDGTIVAIDAPHGAFPDAETVDLGGRFLLPAFIDAHLHLTLGATTLAQCDLSGARSRDEFEARIARH
ncbi:MAG: hypothetical protein RI967_381, partial [Planctomycetota bacterium]